MEVFLYHAVNNVAYYIILLTLKNFRFEENKYKKKVKPSITKQGFSQLESRESFSIFPMREADDRLLVEYIFYYYFSLPGRVSSIEWINFYELYLLSLC